MNPEARVLALVRDHTQPDGWCYLSARAPEVAAAGLDRNAWTRATARLRAGPIPALEEPPGAVRATARSPLPLRLTDEGRARVSAVTHETPSVARESPGESPRPVFFRTPKSFPKKEENTHSQEPGPIEQPALVSHRSESPRALASHGDALALEVGRRVLAFLGVNAAQVDQDETRMEHEAMKLADAPAPRRADGLRWDEETHPELAAALEDLRDQHSKKDGGCPWQRSREADPSWVMRAYAHTVSCWIAGAQGVRGRKPLEDAWGMYIATLRDIVERHGDHQRLDNVARLPAARESFDQARRDLARHLESRRIGAARRALSVAPGPDLSKLAAQRRAAGPVEVGSLVDALKPEGSR